MEKITYKNKYGKLKIKVCGTYQNVRGITSKNLPDNLFFEIKIAEQIALITENRGIQLSVTADYKKMYLIHHKNSDTGAVCEIINIEFNSNFNATKELSRPSGPLYPNL